MKKKIEIDLKNIFLVTCCGDENNKPIYDESKLADFGWYKFFKISQDLTQKNSLSSKEGLGETVEIDCFFQFFCWDSTSVSSHNMLPGHVSSIWKEQRVSPLSLCSSCLNALKKKSSLLFLGKTGTRQETKKLWTNEYKTYNTGPCHRAEGVRLSICPNR